MRLLMTTDAVGGVWDYALILCQELIASYGLDILLITLGPQPRADQYASAASISGLSLDSIDLPLEWMDDGPAATPAALAALRRIIRQWQPDLLHANQHIFGALHTVVPTIVVSHSDSLSWLRWHQGGDSIHDLRPIPPHWQAYYHDVRAGLLAAGAVVAPSQFVCRNLRELYSPTLDVRVIPNGVSLCPDENQPDNLCHDDHQLDKDGERCIDAMGVGRLWDTAKNLRVLAEAAALLPSAPRRYIAIAGTLSGPQGGQAQLPQAECVHYLGSIPRPVLHQKLRRCRIFVTAATYEPFGLAAVEAALAGCAIIAADTPSLREVWAAAATYFPAKDSRVLARLLTETFDCPEKRRSMASAAYQRATHYTPQAMAIAYAQLYQQVSQTPTSVSAFV